MGSVWYESTLKHEALTRKAILCGKYTDLGFVNLSSIFGSHHVQNENCTVPNRYCDMFLRRL